MYNVRLQFNKSGGEITSSKWDISYVIKQQEHCIYKDIQQENEVVISLYLRI